MHRHPMFPFDPSPQAAALDAALAQESQDASDTVLAWLALYLPCWGTSLLLHTSILLLVAFVAWQRPTVLNGATSSWVWQSDLVRKLNIEERAKPPEPRPDPRSQDRSQGRGDLRPMPSSISPLLSFNPPDAGGNGLARLEVLGTGGGGDRYGGFKGLGTGRGIFNPPTDEMRPDTCRKVVYVVDRSGSMTDSLEIVKMELKRSLSELGVENQFHVIFYSSGPPVEMPARRLMNATEHNKQMAFQFIDAVIAAGETDPTQALERAFAVKPDLIYLLTDGEFDRSIVGFIKRLNPGAKVAVMTIGFLYTQGAEGEHVLKTIAEQNGGTYKFVSEADLASLAGG